MTPSAEFVWTPEAWAQRIASGNPVYPFEWSVHYLGGARFARVCQGHVRTSRDAPLRDVERLRIVGAGLALDVAAPVPNPRELVLRATVTGYLSNPSAVGVTAYRFGFLDRDGVFVGVVLDGTGKVRNL
jgi:hypothetical protein